MRSQRRASHPATPRLLYPPESPLPGFRIIVIQPLRIDQTKPVPGTEHTACQGLHGPAIRCVNCPKGGSTYPLRPQAREHIAEIVR